MTTAGGGKQKDASFVLFVCFFVQLYRARTARLRLKCGESFFCFDMCIIITTFNNKFLIFFFMKEKKYIIRFWG